MARIPAGVFTLTRGIDGLAAGRVLPSPVLACLRRLAGGPACCALGRREAKPGEPEGAGPDDEPEGSGPDGSRPAGSANGSKDLRADPPEGRRDGGPEDEAGFEEGFSLMGPAWKRHGGG